MDRQISKVYPRPLAVQRASCVHMLSIERTYEHTEPSEWPERGGSSSNWNLSEFRLVANNQKIEIVGPVLTKDMQPPPLSEVAFLT